MGVNILCREEQVNSQGTTTWRVHTVGGVAGGKFRWSVSRMCCTLCVRTILEQRRLLLHTRTRLAVDVDGSEDVVPAAPTRQAALRSACPTVPSHS
jgi:hypothetical protein